jgi:hypothetical protein
MSSKKDFGTPDAPGEEFGDVQEQNTPKQEQKQPESTASKPQANADAYDLSDYINQSREGASTGQRQKLEANEFNDEELLNEAGYSANGEPEVIDTEAEEISEEETQTEISEEWLDIFAWAGVELTDEAMPILLSYLHADDNKDRFKLPPERRDKLKLAWIAFLRKVLPPLDDKGGLLLVIIMLYIENLVVGVWKLVARIMNGTFTWPNFWIFRRFNKKAATKQEPQPQQAQPQPQPAPQQTSADVQALTPEVVTPAPAITQQQEPAKPAFEPTDIYLPEAKAIEGSKGMFQDVLDGSPFEGKKGQPKKDKVTVSTKNKNRYHVKAKSFKNQSSYQKYLHKIGFYKTPEQLTEDE